MLIVSDDFSGLSSAISALFPDTNHQLCLIHMKRNLRRNMSKGDVKAFHEELQIIKRINDFEKALVSQLSIKNLSV